jgi:ABC-2 type transport system permease protein
MNKVPGTIKLGLLRGQMEIIQFSRQKEAVVFTIFFPVILLVIFGSVFKDTIAPGVTFSQYFVAGMIASGLVNTGFQNIAINIPLERDMGAIKRLRGTPLPITSYFIGKAISVLVTMIVQVLILLVIGAAFFGLNMPTDPSKWLTFTWILILGTASSTALGVAFLAGLGTGFWKDQEELKKIWQKEATFQPIQNENTAKIVSLWNLRMGKITTK